jgi:hypothetical protein
VFKLTGDLKDAKNNLLTEEVELWKRNPIELIEELIGNPVFKEGMKYAPYKVHEGARRAWNQAASADAWCASNKAVQTWMSSVIAQGSGLIFVTKVSIFGYSSRRDDWPSTLEWVSNWPR